MNINEKIVLKMEKELECPILEMFYTEEDNHWYVCFEEFYRIEGEDQDTHLDKVIEEVKKYDNVKYLTDEVYVDDNRPDTYFEQVTFQWEK